MGDMTATLLLASPTPRWKRPAKAENSSLEATEKGTVWILFNSCAGGMSVRIVLLFLFVPNFSFFILTRGWCSVWDGHLIVLRGSEEKQQRWYMCVPDLADRIIDAKTEEAVPAIPIAVSPRPPLCQRMQRWAASDHFFSLFSSSPSQLDS